MEHVDDVRSLDLVIFHYRTSLRDFNSGDLVIFHYRTPLRVIDDFFCFWILNIFQTKQNILPDFEYFVAKNLLVKKRFLQCRQKAGQKCPELFVYNCKQAH